MYNNFKLLAKQLLTSPVILQGCNFIPNRSDALGNNNNHPTANIRLYGSIFVCNPEDTPVMA